MMEDPKLEQIARAIHSAGYRTVEEARHVWDNAMSESMKDVCRVEARLAVATLRNCTPTMIEAGCAAHPPGDYHCATTLEDIILAEWRAMCDAVLRP